jgi:hypothetical protein
MLMDSVHLSMSTHARLLLCGFIYVTLILLSCYRGFLFSYFLRSCIRLESLDAFHFGVNLRIFIGSFEF